MATAKAMVGVTLNMNGQASITLFEGDVIEGLTYKSGEETKTISGTVRVIHGSIRANSTAPKNCPPEPYAQKYITVTALIIDSSSEFDAELQRVDINSIVSIGSVNGEKLAASVNGVYYSSVAEAIQAAAPGDTVVVMESANIDNITLGIGTDITIQGMSDDIVLHGKFSCTAVDPSKSASPEVHLTLKNLTLDGANYDTKSGFGIISNGASAVSLDQVVGCYITCDHVIFQNFKGKAIYATNAKNLLLTNCTFRNNATGEMNTPNTVGDYTIDLNLIGVKGVNAHISNCTFEGICGGKAVIKVAQRGGPSDLEATDIPKSLGVASVESFRIDNCAFNDESTPVDLNIGTTSKSTGTPANTTGHYMVDIVDCSTAVVVMSPYKTTDNILTIPVGCDAHKEPDRDIELA